MGTTEESNKDAEETCSRNTWALLYRTIDGCHFHQEVKRYSTYHIYLNAW